AAELVVDATALVALGADDVQAPGGDDLLALAGAGLLVARQELIVLVLEFLRRLLELLTHVLDGLRVLLARLLVLALRRGERLLERLAVLEEALLGFVDLAFDGGVAGLGFRQRRARAVAERLLHGALVVRAGAVEAGAQRAEAVAFGGMVEGAEEI